MKEDDEDFWRIAPSQEGTDYTVSCTTDRKSVGIHTLVFHFKGNYTGTIKYSFTILPKGTTLSSVKPAKKKITVKWKAQKIQTTGYQIQYGLKKNFKGARIKKVNKNSKKKLVIKGLKSKKKYYVRIRTVKKVNGKEICSAWSKAKTVKVK